MFWKILCAQRAKILQKSISGTYRECADAHFAAFSLRWIISNHNSSWSNNLKINPNKLKSLSLSLSLCLFCSVSSSISIPKYFTEFPLEKVWILFYSNNQFVGLGNRDEKRETKKGREKWIWLLVVCEWNKEKNAFDHFDYKFKNFLKMSQRKFKERKKERQKSNNGINQCDIVCACVLISLSTSPWWAH